MAIDLRASSCADELANTNSSYIFAASSNLLGSDGGSSRFQSFWAHIRQNLQKPTSLETALVEAKIQTFLSKFHTLRKPGTIEIWFGDRSFAFGLSTLVFRPQEERDESKGRIREQTIIHETAHVVFLDNLVNNITIDLIAKGKLEETQAVLAIYKRVGEIITKDGKLNSEALALLSNFRSRSRILTQSLGYNPVWISLELGVQGSVIEAYNEFFVSVANAVYYKDPEADVPPARGLERDHEGYIMLGASTPDQRSSRSFLNNLSIDTWSDRDAHHSFGAVRSLLWKQFCTGKNEIDFHIVEKIYHAIELEILRISALPKAPSDLYSTDIPLLAKNLWNQIQNQP